MKKCPKGFICFDYSKFLLICLILFFIAYYVYNNFKQETNKTIENNIDYVHKVINLENKVLNSKLDDIKTENKIQEIKESNQLANLNRPNPPKQYYENNNMYIIDHAYSRTVSSTLPYQRQHPYLSNYDNNLRNIGIPINIPTRGPSGEYQQVGICVNNGNDKILPLYGRRVYPGSSKWFYYTATDKFREVRLPIMKDKKNCSGDYGCDELYNDDVINIPAYNEPFRINLYSLSPPQYIPFI